MKRKLLAVSFICTCLSFIASDCSNDGASPLNPQNSIGVISYTEDGGDTWFTRNVALAGEVMSVCSFPSDMDTFCIVVSYSGNHEILKTTNSGSNFVSVYSSPDFINDITGLMTEGKGFAVGSSGLILITTNFGSDWTQIQTGTAATLKSIDFGNEMNGIITGNENILTTTNGGTNWIIHPDTENLNSVSFITSIPGTEAVACGNSGKIFRTVNNGENWIQISSPVNESLISVDFIDPVGIIGYASETALRSTDRGLTWYTVPTPSQGVFSKVYTEGSYYWLISNVNLLRSTDQGQTWISRLPENVHLNDGLFSKEKGIVAGGRN